MWVLNDITSSVSAEKGVCVTLLQWKFRGEDTTATAASSIRTSSKGRKGLRGGFGVSAQK